ncbi:unnamed protein product [Closterium sp. NIES-53]
MASLRVLVFDHEGRPVAFDTWHDDLQLYLLSDIKDSVSLFDHESGVAPARPATADSATRSQWLSRDATARLAIRNHLPVAECTHFGQHRTAQTLYDAVVARYSSPATAALGKLLLPYLFPELSAFATVADLVTHLRTSDAPYRATIPAEFLAINQHPMFITLYFIVSRLPDSLRSVRDHFLSLDPTSLTVDLLEQHLLAAETSAVACKALARARVAGVVEVAAVVVEVAVGAVVGAAVEVVDVRMLLFSSLHGCTGGGGGSGTSGGSEGSGGGGGGSGGSGGSGGGGSGGGRSGPRHGGPGGGQRQQQQQRRSGWFSVGRVGTDLLRSGVAIFDLDYDAIISAMYALSVSAEGDCYRCVPPDPGIAAAALGASASGTPPGTAPAEALHTFTLDSGASRCFLRESTTLTPLLAPVPVGLADPSGGPVNAHSSTVLPCPAVPSGSLSGLHLPSFSTNLVSTAALQDAMVTTTTPGGSSLYTLAIEPPLVAASAQVSASGQVAASCSYRLLSHQTLLWHHRLGHPSLPRLHGMHSQFLVSSLPMSLPPLPPSPTPPCLHCVEGRQRAAPRSSSFPPTSAPLQTLHVDVWGPARVSGQGRERYFLLVVDDYTRYTTVFPLRSKGILSWEGHSPVVHASGLPQQKGIAERRIGLVMEVPRTSMIHAAAPHFLWPFAVRYAAHQLNLWPRVSLPETSPTLRWTGKVGDASVFRVWGSRAFVRDTSADKLSARAIPSGFLGFVPDAPCWHFYHPTSRRVLPSQDVTFAESVPFYRLFPYRSTPPPPRSLFLASGPPPVDPLPPQGPAPSGVSEVVPLPGTAPVQVAVGSGAGLGAASGGDASGGAELWVAGSEGAEPRGAEPEGVEPGGAESEGAESGGAVPRGAASSGGPAVAGDTGAGGAAVTTGVGDTGGTAATGPGGARTSAGAGGAGAGGAGVGGTGAGDARAVRARAVDPGAGERREPASRPVLPVRTARCAPRSRPPPVPCTNAMALPRAASPTVSLLLATAVTDPSFESAAASALVAELLDFAAACRLDYATALVAEFESASPPSVGGECALGTDVFEDRQEDFECLAAAVPHFASMLLALEGDPDAPDIPTPRFYAEAITGPYSSQWQAAMDAEMASWKSTGTYVDEFPLSQANIVDGMWIFRVKRPPGSPPAFKARYVARGFSKRLGRDFELHPLDFSTAFLQGSLHEEIWLRRPPGFTGTFPAGTQWGFCRPVYGLRQAPREWHDTLRTTLAALRFVPSTAYLSLFLHTDISLPPFYVLVYVLQRFGFQFSSPQPTPLSTSHSLSAPPSDESVEPSGPYPELVGCLMYLMTCTQPDLAYHLSLLARYVAPGRHRKVHWDVAKRVLRYLCITSGMGLVLGGRGPVVLTGHADVSWVDDSATQYSSQGYTFSLGSGSVSWWSTGSSSVLSSSCEAEIYAGAMAAQELR